MVKGHSDSERIKPTADKVFFTCTISQTGQHTPQPLLHQLWNTGWNEK